MSKKSVTMTVACAEHSSDQDAVRFGSDFPDSSEGNWIDYLSGSTKKIVFVHRLREL